MVETHISPKGINRGGLPQNHVEVDCVTWRFMMLAARKDGFYKRVAQHCIRKGLQSITSMIEPVSLAAWKDTQFGGMAELADAKVCDYRENIVLSFPIWNFSSSCMFESCYHHKPLGWKKPKQE